MSVNVGDSGATDKGRPTGRGNLIALRIRSMVSVPNDIFENATRAAAALGMSRSAFFARAAERYLQQIEKPSR
jgi:hypothetical protein